MLTNPAKVKIQNQAFGGAYFFDIILLYCSTQGSEAFVIVNASINPALAWSTISHKFQPL